MGKIAGILLAAGASVRFGEPKALVSLDGERLVDRGVRVLREAGCAPVLVVTGAAPVETLGALIVPNAHWRDGMGSSLRAGLEALPPDCPAVVVTLVDQPGIGPEAVRLLIAEHRAGASAVAASFGGRGAEPLLVAREHFAALTASAVGEAGPRSYLHAHPVTLVPCDDVASPDDLDSPGDLESLF
ncbi:nucleotidyltransferase family protein [Actinocorallia longicatena]